MSIRDSNLPNKYAIRGLHTRRGGTEIHLLAVDAAIDGGPAANIIIMPVGEERVVGEPLLGVGLRLERHGRRRAGERGALVFVAFPEIGALTVLVAVAHRSTGRDQYRTLTTMNI